MSSWPPYFRVLLAALAVTSVMTGSRPAAAQTVAPDWRIQASVDGGTAAVASDGTYAVTVACGKRPEISVAAKGAAAPARAMLIETADITMAFPLARDGKPSAADALAAGLFDPADKAFRIFVDEQPLPAGGAREAFEQIGKDCERRAGWQYGNDNEQQLIWMFTARSDEPPVLMFGKPSTGWLMAQLSCDRGTGALIAKSTVLPRRARNGQKVPLTLRIGGTEYTAGGVVEKFEEGDVAGFVGAPFERPQPLLDSLRQAATITFAARDASPLTISGAGLGSLLPRFLRACAMK